MRLFIGIFFFIFTSIVNAADFTLSSASFPNGGAMPTVFTCDGKDISPQISWKNAPADTKSFAIIFSDPDAPGGNWTHWIVYNLPSDSKEIAENSEHLPTGAALGKNSWGVTRYNGPCPPKGSTHTYSLTVYALDTKLNLNNPDGKTIEQAIAGHVIKEAKLMAIYSRRKT